MRPRKMCRPPRRRTDPPTNFWVWRRGSGEELGRSRAGFGIGARSRGRSRLLVELEGARAAEDAGAFVARARALGILELGLDVVAVAVALHGENSVRVALGHMPFGRKLGAAVVRDLAFDQQTPGPALFAVLPVIKIVLDRAGKFPFVSRSFSMRFAGEVRDPVAVEAPPCRLPAGQGRTGGSHRNCHSRQKHQRTNHRRPHRFSHFHVSPSAALGRHPKTTGCAGVSS